MPSPSEYEIRVAMAQYRSLLDARVDENRIQEFLASHVYFFHMHLIDAVYAYPLFSKIRLGSEYETDFVGVIPSSFGPEWRLAEIESPRQPMFTSCDEFSAPLNHAVQQVRDWIRWCEDHREYVRNLLPGLKYPLGLVFCGRRFELNELRREKLRQLNHESSDFRVRTLDALLDAARNGEAFADEIPPNAVPHTGLVTLAETLRERLSQPIDEELAQRRRNPRIWDIEG